MLILGDVTAQVVTLRKPTLNRSASYQSASYFRYILSWAIGFMVIYEAPLWPGQRRCTAMMIYHRKAFFWSSSLLPNQPATSIASSYVFATWFLPCHGSGSQSLDSHRGRSASIACHIPWDLWWTERQHDRFSPQYFCFSPVSIISPMLHPDSLICHRRCSCSCLQCR